MKKLSFFASCFLMLAVLSCTKEDTESYKPGKTFEGKQVSVPVSMHIGAEFSGEGQEIPFSRAPLDTDEDKISNVWVFQFDTNSDDGVLLIPPYYVDDEEMQVAMSGSGLVNVPLIESGLDESSQPREHLLVFVANTNDNGFNWSMQPGASTYADLKSRYYRMQSEGITYGYESGKNLIMSGKAVSPVDPNIVIDGDDDYTTNTGPGVEMVRSLAKIELELSIDGTPGKAEGYTVVSVQMRNVSSQLDMLDGQKSHLSGKYPLDLKVIDYEPVKNTDYAPLVTDANDEGSSVKFQWFVPRNMRGVNTHSVSPKTKNSFAPNGSSYIEIVANDAEGYAVRFIIYPGANDTDDFNLLGNHIYKVKLNIMGDGGESVVDTRIERYKKVKFDGANNSFILNPPPAGGKAVPFQIPITRVNQYWKPVQHGYGGLNEDAIKASDTWTVDLLWQDRPDLVRPFGEDEDTYVILSKKTGTGGDDYFEVTVPHIPRERHGNCVMVIRKGSGGSEATGDILWSWHLWVTDYDPNPGRVTLEGDRFTYQVPNGQVERYGGLVWGYTNFYGGSYVDPSNTYAPVGWDWDDYTYDPTVTAQRPYSRSVIMDRNVGAIGSGFVQNYRGTYYQFGSFCPIPGPEFSLDSKNKMCDINGTPLSAKETGAPSNFPQQWGGSVTYNQESRHNNFQEADPVLGTRQIVRNPLAFIANNHTLLDGNNYLWNDSQLNRNDGRNKSIFDPCPAGWRLPVSVMASNESPRGPSYLKDVETGVWQDFVSNRTTLNDARGIAYDYNEGVFRYWPNWEKGGNYPVEGDIVYNVTGQIYRHSPSVTYSMFVYYTPTNTSGSQYANLWSSTPHATNATYGHMGGIGSTSATGNGSTYKYIGYPVRCMADVPN